MIDRLASIYVADTTQTPAAPQELRLPEKWTAWHGGLNIHAFLKDQKYDTKSVTCSKEDSEYVAGLASKCANNDYSPIQTASNKVRDFRRAYRYGAAADEDGQHQIAQMFFDRCRSLVLAAFGSDPDGFTYPKGYHPTKTALEIHRDTYPHTHSELSHFVSAQGDADKVSSEDTRKTFLSRADLSTPERRRIRQMSAAEFDRLVDSIRTDVQSKVAREPSWMELLKTRYGDKELAPESKDTKRIDDLAEKSKYDADKMQQFARNMAKAITDAAKAYRRGRAAENENYHDLADIFYDRSEAIVNGW